MEPQSPGNYYEKLYNEAERIEKRNREIQKQFEKRFKIRKHGCQYLSLITDLMTGNQNYGIRSIEKEFQMLVDLHTGTGSSNRYEPVRPVRQERFWTLIKISITFKNQEYGSLRENAGYHIKISQAYLLWIRHILLQFACHQKQDQQIGEKQ